MSERQTAVVTGSSRGLGFGLVTSFLARGCNVVVNGRASVALKEAATKLGESDRVLVVQGDVSSAEPLQALWAGAKQRFGRVDFWVNNAGAGGAQVPFLEQTVESIATLAQTNLTGMVLATRIALEGMTQQGSGQIFNLEGFGSNPRIKRSGMAVYGATKCATRYFTQSVARELEDSKVLIGTLSPGVVVTELLVRQFDGQPAASWERAKKFYNKMADEVGTVAPYLVDEMLANTKQGAAIEWVNPLQMLLRIISPFRNGRDLLSKVPGPNVR